MVFLLCPIMMVLVMLFMLLKQRKDAGNGRCH
jgi:preprotein translocase subunit YajC